MIEIKTFCKEDIPSLQRLKEAEEGYSNDSAYFEESWHQQEQARRLVFVAFQGGQPVGYVHYNKYPQYQPFRSLEIPEIQDLRVARSCQKQGIGAALIHHCEMQALQDSYDMMGIAVGLTSSYGSAQRLYVRLGYVPDGGGVVYDRLAVTHGEMRPVDDNLCLMMLKSLK